MTARPVFVKLAAFSAAFAAAVALAAVFTPAPLHHPHTPSVAPPLSCDPASEFALAENLRSEVELVTIDRESGRSYTRLKLRLAGRGRAPERLWVRTYFFSASDKTGHQWADDSVEVVRPFADGDTTSVTVSAPCDWCGDRAVPDGGYFARVKIFDGREETALPPGAQAGDIRTAVPVVVHAARVPPARR